ncbi:mCG141553, isoform CRA_a, partial [Mus musculus]
TLLCLYHQPVGRKASEQVSTELLSQLNIHQLIQVCFSVLFLPSFFLLPVRSSQCGPGKVTSTSQRSACQPGLQSEFQNTQGYTEKQQQQPSRHFGVMGPCWESWPGEMSTFHRGRGCYSQRVSLRHWGI